MGVINDWDVGRTLKKLVNQITTQKNDIIFKFEIL